MESHRGRRCHGRAHRRCVASSHRRGLLTFLQTGNVLTFQSNVEKISRVQPHMLTNVPEGMKEMVRLVESQTAPCPHPCPHPCPLAGAHVSAPCSAADHAGDAREHSPRCGRCSARPVL